MNTPTQADTLPLHARATHSAQPASRGVHHLALNTDDMKMTIDFYTRVMGMPLIHALKVPPGVGAGPLNRGNPPFENLRHYFFDAGGDAMVAFFELPKGATGTADRNAVAAMQHCSFTTTKAQFEVLLARLNDHQVPVIGPVNVGAGSWSIYFFDPNGIRLEYTYQEGDGHDVRVIERWTQTRDEMMAELATLSSDKGWLARVTAHLPDQRS
jgi:catechol 2,3-dioxygenase-like lactoylglutathione lyase family enzyme